MAEVFRHRSDDLSLSQILTAVEKWRYASPPEDHALEELEACWRSLSGKSDSVSRQLRVTTSLLLGNLHREAGRRDDALACYDRGLEGWQGPEEGGEVLANEVANLRTNRAICLMGGERWAEALDDLEDAIRLRESLPLDEQPVFRWGFAAGWINRGDVLSALGRDEESIASYDRALEELALMESSAAVAQRTAVAWNNRGLVLEKLDRRTEAGESFGNASSGLEGATDELALLTRAAARLHQSRVSGTGDIEGAWEALRSSIDFERSNPTAAEISLKARHRICQCLCRDLGGRESGTGDWIGTTTDLVDEGLELSRAWEEAGVSALRPVALDLFRLGLRVYRVCQPHFLAEFILESLDPEASPGAPGGDPDFQAAAVETLSVALRESLERGVLEDRGEKELAIGRALRAADERLAAIQAAG